MIITKPNGYITLVTVIAVAAVGSLVALLILFSGVSSSKTSLSLQQSAQAKEAADGCAELALAAIQANIALSTPTLSLIHISFVYGREGVKLAGDRSRATEIANAGVEVVRCV